MAPLSALCVLCAASFWNVASAGHDATWEAAAHAHVHAHSAELVDSLQELVNIPSVSALPANSKDVRRAAEWTAARLRAMGVAHVAVYETGGHPVVYGEWLGAGASMPTVLVYGHSDVQPAEPYDLWLSPPFNATMFEHDTDGTSVRGRGASDDKGGVVAALGGLAAVSATGDGRFPVNLKFLLEAQVSRRLCSCVRVDAHLPFLQEEIGSPQLESFIVSHADLLAADMALSADGDQHSPTQPSLTVSYRGAVAMQVDVRTSSHDLHSGSFGGSVPNAAHVLSRLLAGLHTAEGAVAAPEFYALVRARTPEERAAIAAVPLDVEDDMRTAGVTGYTGEPGFSTLERRWVRPTAEVTGVWSGWTGEGVKTVLPADAHARIVCRLVADQTPQQAFDAIRNHLLRLAPDASLAVVNITRLGFSGSPVEASPSAPANAAAIEVLRHLYEREPLMKRSGGSIPALGFFKQHLGVDTTTFAFGHAGNSVHAPNEHFAVRDLLRGARAWSTILFRIAEQHAQAMSTAMRPVDGEL